MNYSSTFSMRLDPKTVEYLDQLARNRQCSRASVVRWLIQHAALGSDSLQSDGNQSYIALLQELLKQLVLELIVEEDTHV